MLVLSVVLAGIAPPIAGPIDPVARVILALVVVLVGAKLGGEVAERLGQPAVLGELLAGIFLGNLELVGVSWVGSIPGDAAIAVLAKLGAVLLLFEVGLESTVGDIMKVGGRAFTVATLGVVTPWVLGWGVGVLFLPNSSSYVHAFLGATLTATSVGITARVLSDLGRAQSPEARVILGAAVIDDVMGLVILAGITSVISTADRGTGVSYIDLAFVFGKALVFLVGALVVRRKLSPRLFGLAVGMRVRLETFAHPDILGLAGLLTVAAILGKQACALGGLGAQLNKLAIGVGMIPRGEVGLIFANLSLGITLHGETVVSKGIYSAVVIMVVLTELNTPPALTW